MLKINVEHTKGNEGSYFYLYSFEDLVQESFQGGFYLCITQRSFLKTFIIESQVLWLDWNLTEN